MANSGKMPSPKPQPPINFDEVTHTYADPDTGVVVPSVTQVLDAMTGPKFYPDNGSRELGHLIHKMYERLDLGTLIPAFYTDPLHLEYLDQYKCFHTDFYIGFSGIEQRIYNKELRYAGTADRVGYYKDIPFTERGSRFIADIKTGSTMANANLQTAAYAMALFDDYEAVDRFVIQVHPQTLNGYRLFKYDDPIDFVKWKGMLERYHEMG